MIVFQAVFIGLVLFASQTFANICTGRRNGEQFPNPSDCGTFYVCNFGESKLFDCPADLLYDVSLRACNWAYMVNCSQVIDPEAPVVTILPPTGHVEYTNKPELSPATPEPTQASQEPTQASQEPTPATQEPTPATPRPTQGIPEVTPAIPGSNETSEVSPGILEISPNVFHCKNPEFYFAPHPRDCEQYFICENTRIHPYECGNGLYWDYLNNRCNLPLNALCYPIIPPESTGKLVCTSGGRTIEYEESQCRFVSGQIGTVVPVDEPVVPVDTDTPVVPVEIECPDTQAFIEHTEDCMKYYICIGGMPIVTSCPEKTAWDNSLSQCNEESFKRCFP